MELQDQVISLEKAKKFKELGFERDALFYWIENSLGVEKSHIKLATQTKSYKLRGKVKSSGAVKYYPAYTVSELMDILPTKINGGRLHIEKQTENYKVYYENYYPGCIYHKLPIALGDMLIHLISEGISFTSYTLPTTHDTRKYEKDEILTYSIFTIQSESMR